MIPDNVIYTDGHGVTITDTKFKVGKHDYKLSGITKYGMYVLKPRKLPAIFLLVIGLLMAAVGFLGILPVTDVPAIETAEGFIGANTVVLWVGIFLATLGILVLAAMRKKYAVRIDTAQGEKNAVVSKRRAYISQITDALSEAIFRRKPSHLDTPAAGHREIRRREEKFERINRPKERSEK